MVAIPNIPLWIIIVAAIIVVLIIMFRTMNQVYLLSMVKNNFFYYFLILFLAIFVISAINIHRSVEVDYSTLDGWRAIFKAYGVWIWSVVSNLGKITGYVVSQEWIAKPTNATGVAG